MWAALFGSEVAESVVDAWLASEFGPTDSSAENRKSEETDPAPILVRSYLVIDPSDSIEPIQLSIFTSRRMNSLQVLLAQLSWEDLRKIQVDFGAHDECTTQHFVDVLVFKEECRSDEPACCGHPRLVLAQRSTSCG